MNRFGFHTALRLTVLLANLVPSTVGAQTARVFPDQVPNGVEAFAGEAFHQRMTIMLDPQATASSRGLTIVLPSEFNYVAYSATSITSGHPSRTITFLGASTGALAFALSPSEASFAGERITVEFDITTPSLFSGIPSGFSSERSYSLEFSPDTQQEDQAAEVDLHQYLPLSVVAFASPDSLLGDTTSAGGRFYKIEFPNALPDLSHTQMSGLGQYGSVGSTPPMDDAGDVLYSFYLSSDSTLISRPLGFPQTSLFSLAVDRSPVSGSRQIPRPIPRTFVREDYVSVFQADAADTLNGVVSLAGTVDQRAYFVYLLADPAPDRDPATWLEHSGWAKKGFDPTRLGAFTGGVFLGRSGPLYVRHPPEFVVAGWDYDDDGGDAFAQTGVVQIPSDLPNMAPVDANRKDNRDIKVDSGLLVSKGDALNTLNGGLPPSPVSSVDLLYTLADADNPSGVEMAIYLTTISGLLASDFTSPAPSVEGLPLGIRLPESDTLGVSDRTYNFDSRMVDPASPSMEYLIPEESYFVYFAATDGTYRTLHQVRRDPFVPGSGAATLTVLHSKKSPDFDGDGRVDFEDFLLFVSHFGARVGDTTFDAIFDLDSDGSIVFADFLIFVSRFGETT